METASPKFAMRGIILWLLILGCAIAQEMPTIDFANSESQETGLKIDFLLSDPIERGDIAGWIEQENWFILNFYHIIRPDSGFIKNIATYPIQDIQQVWTNNSLQLSFQIARKIGSFDVILHDNGRKVLVVLTYADYVRPKDVNPSFVFPNPKDAEKITHPISWYNPPGNNPLYASRVLHRLHALTVNGLPIDYPHKWEGRLYHR